MYPFWTGFPFCLTSIVNPLSAAPVSKSALVTVMLPVPVDVLALAGLTVCQFGDERMRGAENSVVTSSSKMKMRGDFPLLMTM